ncbi:hypothetical protein CNG02515 [Cryptococcus deneoformans JEC21]|uniref:Uncharacterized protein n=1 Tax=Cryptococcus deneoformans (strain JEC21 / ATCC MYA-565) TaxID=214684 RepID=A0A0S2M607_CRYD1|nr:hypothetical protein CNG02515 [Cryptococcus neoformans var. neoformans JEC21]ALO69291.1 hypothetical protein CNG02515 [Cryptococcus neoformans var. neoformans JEC21]
MHGPSVSTNGFEQPRAMSFDHYALGFHFLFPHGCYSTNRFILLVLFFTGFASATILDARIIMPGVNYVSSSLNRTKRKWSVQADEEAYPRIPSGYIRRKPRGMFAYLKPPPPLLGEENDQHVQQEEGQTQEEHLERPQASEKNDNPIIQPKDKSQSIDFGFSWAVPFMPAQQKVEKPFGNNDKAHTSRKNSFLPGAHHLPWFMTWDNNTWPGKTGDHLMECEEEPQHYHSTISSPDRRVRKILAKNNVFQLDLSLRPSQSRTYSPYKRQRDLDSKGKY